MYPLQNVFRTHNSFCKRPAIHNKDHIPNISALKAVLKLSNYVIHLENNGSLFCSVEAAYLNVYMILV